MEKRLSFNSIQAMRGVAAILVVLFHCRVYINNTYSQPNLGDMLFSYGYLGVDLFFIISGFIITHATSDKSNDSGLIYISKRFFRIYPVYAFSLIMLCIFRGMDLDTLTLSGGYTLDNILKSLLLIPLNMNSEAPYYGYGLLIVSWTLTYELIFYTFFFIGMSINHRFRGLITSIIISAGFIAVGFINGDFNPDPRKYHFEIKIIELITNPIMLNFILGILSYYLFMLIRNRSGGLFIKTSFFILGLSLLMLFSGSFTGHGVFNFGILSFLAFISLLVIIEERKITVHKSILFLGKISYSLYLTHIVVIYSLEKYQRHFPLIGGTNGWSKLISVVILSMILSSLIYYIIEKPSSNFIRKKSRNKAA